MTTLKPVHVRVHWYGQQFHIGEVPPEPLDGNERWAHRHSREGCNRHCYLARLVPVEPTLEGPRDGTTFDPEKDLVRLNGQMLDVYKVMIWGDWHTIDNVQQLIVSRYGRHYSQAGISARIRDFRKPKFGSHTVRRRRHHETGLWQYKLIWNEEVPRP